MRESREREKRRGGWGESRGGWGVGERGGG